MKNERILAIFQEIEKVKMSSLIKLKVKRGRLKSNF
jgi:hypothetical protein